jgi:hypothetical protein
MSTIHLPISDWIENVAAAALTSMDTVKATFDLACNAVGRDIPGDFVECGVFGGVQCAMMARGIMFMRENFAGTAPRKVHIFDCFGGIPEPGPHDLDIDTPEKYRTFREQTTCSMKDVQFNMRQWGVPDELLVYHPGRFEETIPALNPHFPIAMLRLDGDLHESVKVCIDGLLPDVSVGGWVIIDDWGLKGARKAAMEASIEAGPIYWKQPPRYK